jgi:zinc protease
VDASDPESLLEHYRRELLGLYRPDEPGMVGPLLLVVTGDVEPGPVMRLLEAEFADAPGGRWTLPPLMSPQTPVEVQAAVLYPVAQERVGYTVKVPGPRPETAVAWQMALYVLSHGYEGRLGKEAISRRGLVYRIGSDYRTDGRNDWITLDIGVDPSRREAMVALLKEQLAALLTGPPSQAEVDEARAHLLGRFTSEAQSNAELADRLTRQWLWYRDVPGYEAWERKLDAVQRQDILDLLPAFTRGSIISITNPQDPE